MMALPTLTTQGKANLDELIHEVVENRKLPALFLTACNADEVIYENQDGFVNFDEQDGKRVDADTTIHLFSMTKLMTSIAVHQLVDRGLATLDDPDIVGHYLPEIGLDKLEILDGWDDENDKPILRKATKPITLAMLLSHSAGFCYTFSGPPLIQKWLKQNPKKGIFESGATMADYLQPLLYEPGTSFHYSTSVDWAGFFIERRTGLSLEDYFQKNLFGPLAIKTMTMLLKPEIMDRLIKPCALDKDGNLSVLPPSPMGKPVKAEDVTVFNGGGGLYGTTRDYLKVLQAVLKSSPAYKSNNPDFKPVLSAASFKALFTGVLAPQGVKKLRLLLDIEFYHLPSAPTDDLQYSPGLLIYPHGGELGRKPGTGCWDGLMRTFFWIDPETGIAAECNTNVLVSGNNNIIGQTIRSFEKRLYEGLKMD